MKFEDQEDNVLYSPTIAHIYYVRRGQSGMDEGKDSTSREVRTWRAITQLITICPYFLIKRTR